MRQFLLIFFFSITLISKAQIARGEFAIGGAGFEYGECIIQTNDHGYMIAGITNSFGAGKSDMYAIKLDSNAQLQWTKTIGGVRNDAAYSVIQTNDMGYAMVGTTYSYGDTTHGNIYLVKLDVNGNVLWTQTYGNAGGGGNSVLQTADGRYVITSSLGSNMCVIRTDQLGNIAWSKVLNASVGYSVIQTHDGGFAVSGYIGYAYFYIAKLDSGGNVGWARTIGGGNEQGAKLIETSDRGLVMAGFGRTYGVCCNNNFYIAKLDSAGNLKWTKTVGGVSRDEAYSIIETKNKELVIAGVDGSYGVGADMYIVKLNAAGTLISTKTVGGAGYDMALSIIQTTDLGYALAGYTTSYGAGSYDVYMVKLDSNFVPNCADTSHGATVRYGGTSTPGFTLVAVSPTTYPSGATINTGGVYTNICSTTSIPSSALVNNISVVPNPTTGYIKVNSVNASLNNQINIYNSLGARIFYGELKDKETEIDLSNQSNGIYFIKITSANGTETKKIIKQ
jgi:hypothetical protein